MRCGEFCHGNVASGLVGHQGALGGLFAVVGCCEFGEVTVVVALHLVVKYFGFTRVSTRNQMFVEHVQNVSTNLAKLLFNLKSNVISIRSSTSLAVIQV